MKITVSLGAVGAGILGTVGTSIIVLVMFGALPRQWPLLGFLLLFMGGISWVHHRVEVLGERLAEREWAAYEMGRLSGPGRSRVSSVPQQRAPQGLPTGPL